VTSLSPIPACQMVVAIFIFFEMFLSMNIRTMINKAIGRMKDIDCFVTFFFLYFSFTTTLNNLVLQYLYMAIIL
jgi:hypothetical protein